MQRSYVSDQSVARLDQLEAGFFELVKSMPDLSGAAEAEVSDVTAHSADGGSDDCEKPPARELLGTTTTV